MPAPPGGTFVPLPSVQGRGQDLRVTGARKPIGYWLKHLDRLIEDTFDRTMTDAGLTRRHWQALNTLARGPSRRSELQTALDPFVRADPAALVTIIDELAAFGWVQTGEDGRWCLTASGVAAHQRIQEDVDRTRRLILTNVTADEYTQVIDVLQRMATGLESPGNE
jgi:DNA-binding MarR family transcriptional regulator